MVVRRIWHTPLRLIRDRPAPGRVGLAALLQADGDVSVTAAGLDTVALAPNTALISTAGGATRLEAGAPTARIEVISRRRHPETAADAASRVLAPADPTPAWTALASVVTTLLNAPPQPGMTTFPLLQLSLENLLAALWVEAGESAAPPASGERDEPSLYARARQLIHDRAADPDLTVEEVARALGVTRPHLTRVFRPHGVSPAASLRAARLALARTALASSPRPDLEAVARSSGFPSARALRAALREA